MEEQGVPQVGILRHWLLNNCSRTSFSCGVREREDVDADVLIYNNRYYRRLARQNLGPSRDYGSFFSAD